MSLPTPFYDQDGITLYCGDCRKILPLFPDKSFDLCLTDPPYPNMTGRVSEYEQADIGFLDSLPCKQLIFWHSHGTFPIKYQAIHIWDKKTGCQSEYERIFERNSNNGHWRVYRYYLINSSVAANYGSDVFTGHPSQKPIKLIRRLIEESKEVDTILDPFCGSGTTLVAAKQLGRKAIGIEISEKYCEIAVKRLAQMQLEFK